MTSSMKPKQPASYKHAKATTESKHKSARSGEEHTTSKADGASKKTQKGQHAVCPRCREKKISVVTKSPVANVWTVYGCETCLYVWRDTETETYTDPDQYPEAFRVDPKSLSELGDMPTIPALRQKNSG